MARWIRSCVQNKLQQHRNGQSKKLSSTNTSLKDHCPSQTAALMIYDVSYTNIHGTYNVKNPPVHLACSDSVPCTNITLSQVQLHPAAAQGDGELNLDPPFCWKAYRIIETRVTRPLRSCMMGELPKNKFVLQQDSNKRC